MTLPTKGFFSKQGTIVVAGLSAAVACAGVGFQIRDWFEAHAASPSRLSTLEARLTALEARVIDTHEDLAVIMHAMGLERRHQVLTPPQIPVRPSSPVNDGISR